MTFPPSSGVSTERTNCVLERTQCSDSWAKSQEVAAAFDILRDKHAIPSRAVDGQRALARQLVASAQQIRSLSPQARGAASSEHSVLVRQHQQGLDTVVKSIPDLATFLADADAAFRQVHGGGIVSSTLFVGESLERVSVQGDRAWGTRVGTNSVGKEMGRGCRLCSRPIWRVANQALREAPTSSSEERLTPSNKGMKQTKPAQAYGASQLIPGVRRTNGG